MAERAQQALADMPRGTVGLDALRDMAQPERVRVPTDCRMPAMTLPPGLGGVVDALSAAGHGVIMTMGKGGVGKTTVAAAIAAALARKGHPVVLSTTDPAAHVAATIDGVVHGLTVTGIDPTREVRQYTEEVLTKAGTALDAGGRAMLEEDLRSPCTEEIAVFQAFARAVDPMLCQRATYEVPFVRRVADGLAPRTALLPWLAEALVGAAGLERVIT